MAKAIRHQHAARQAAKNAGPPPTSEYEILDPNHRPDLRGHFAGQRVYTRGGKQYVRLNDQQAKFYLDSGSIAKVVPPAPTPPPAPPAT